jgi:glutamyl-tRNA reductase
VVSAGEHLVLLGLSHRTAGTGLREQAALGDAEARAVLRALRRSPAIREAAVLSTCNRTELLAVSPHREWAAATLHEALLAHSRLTPAQLVSVAYVHHDARAVVHLMRVTASLDSMVIGESEIQSQVRAALRLAREEATAGPELERAFGAALAAGRRVRRETRLGAGAVSLAAVAVGMARTQLGDLQRRRGVIVGAGRVAEATARALVGHGLGDVVVINRTCASAGPLAARLGGRVAGLDALVAEVGRADVLISSTGAPLPLLRFDALAPSLAERGPAAPLLLIDLAVPRDIDPRLGALPEVILHDLDDLERVAAANADRRRREAWRAEAIVAAEGRRWSASRSTTVPPERAFAV